METNTHAFIIRIWYEGEENATIWRGSIDHVGSNQRLYFCDLDGAIRFIQEQLGIQSRSPSSGLQTLVRHIRHGILALRGDKDKGSFN